MKRFVRPIVTIGLGLVLALLCAALAASSPPAMQADFPAAFFLQPGAIPPPQEDLSEIGSTDGIIAMGFFIALIIVVPIFIQRRSWMQAS